MHSLEKPEPFRICKQQQQPDNPTTSSFPTMSDHAMINPERTLPFGIYNHVFQGIWITTHVYIFFECRGLLFLNIYSIYITTYIYIYSIETHDDLRDFFFGRSIWLAEELSARATARATAAVRVAYSGHSFGSNGLNNKLLNAGINSCRSIIYYCTIIIIVVTNAVLGPSPHTRGPTPRHRPRKQRSALKAASRLQALEHCGFHNAAVLVPRHPRRPRASRVQLVIRVLFKAARAL